MDDSDDSNIDIADLANNILALLNIQKQLTEEDLYSDEFYILVFSGLMTEEEIQLEPGNTPEEKIENINNILNSLSSLVGDELPPIDAKKIVIDKDKENMKILVGIFYNLIQVVLQENLKMAEEEEKGEDDEELRSHSLNENRMNLSEKKESEKIRRNKDEEINIDNLESLELGKNKNQTKKKGQSRRCRL